MMKRYLFILAALAFAALANIAVPTQAEAANRYATCTTACTWDNTSTAMWCSDVGRTTCGVSAPVAGDDVIFDGATCVGGTTCTTTTFAGTITANSITWGACTASTTGCIIDASVNNMNFTLGATSTTQFSGTGTGTRKWLAGTGTYALTHTGANSCFTMATTTNDQGSVFSGATWSCSGTTANARSWQGGGFSFGPTTFNANTSRGSLLIGGANTFSSLTVNGPNLILLPNATTQTISGAISVNGASASSPVQLTSNNTDNPATVSLGSASSGSWVALRAITTSGAAALNATNCIDMGRNTLANGGACNGPSAGGGGRIIGG